ncbi:MAG: zinc-ribbon domain-containing protein [Deltaproteobacteria bacterium]|nr:zinc-ribbon domain-containing protein [Deltaproteobacteria bacterium]
MQIRCEKCKTEYSLDEKLLAPKGSPVRCTQCGNVFKAFPPASKPPAGSLPPTDPAVPWVLYRKSGETRKFLDTKKLQNFIADGKASGMDLVSRFGGPWKNIAVTTELKGFLPVSRSAAARPRGQGMLGQPQTADTRQPTYRGNVPRQSTSAVPGKPDDASSKKSVSIRSVPSQRTTQPPPANKPAVTTAQKTLIGTPSQIPKKPGNITDIADNSDVSPHDEVTRVAPNPFFYFNEKNKEKEVDTAQIKASQNPNRVTASTARVFDDPLDNDVTQKTPTTKKRELEKKATPPSAENADFQKTQKNPILESKRTENITTSKTIAASPAPPAAPEKSIAASTITTGASVTADTVLKGDTPSVPASASTAPSAATLPKQKTSTAPLEVSPALKEQPPVTHPVTASTAPSTGAAETSSKAAPVRKAAPVSNEAELDFSDVPMTVEEEWSAGTENISHDEPGWTQSSSTISSMSDAETGYKSKKKGRGVVTALISLLLILGIGAGYLWFFQKELLMSHFGEVQDSKKEERQKTLLIEARELVLLDTPSDFEQAEKKYLQVLTIDNKNLEGLAGLAQTYIIWAQQLQDELLDATLDLSAANNSDANNAVEPVTQEALEPLKKNFEARLADGRRRITQALNIESSHALSNLVAAEAELLDGNSEAAKKYLAMGRSPHTIQNSSLVNAKIGIAEQQNNVEIIGMLKSIVAAEPRLRVLNRLARVQLFAGQKDEAQQSIDKILSLNSRHTAALRLKQRIESDKTVALIPAPIAPTADEDIAQRHEKVDSNLPGSSSSDAAEGKKDNAPPQQSPATMSAHQLLRKASAAQQAGRSNEAVSLFSLVLEKDPENIEALNGLGYAYLDLGSRGQAIAKFKRALTVNPGFGPSQIGMAQTYKGMGQNAEALKWYEKYIATNPSGRHAGIAQRNIDDLKPLATAASNLSNSSAGQTDTGTPSAAPIATTPDETSPDERATSAEPAQPSERTESSQPSEKATPSPAPVENPGSEDNAASDMSEVTE